MDSDEVMRFAMETGNTATDRKRTTGKRTQTTGASFPKHKLWEFIHDNADIPIFTWDDAHIYSRIGQGSFSMILKASCPKEIHERVALKCLLEGDLDSKTLAMAANDLKREAHILSQLNHLHIIKLKGFGVPSSEDPSDHNFLVLELLTETLYDRLERWRTVKHIPSHRANEEGDARHNADRKRFLVYRPKYSVESEKAARDREESGLSSVPSLYERLLSIAYKICKAMNYLHSQRIIHCDLKPANIGFDHRGRLKIFDFGLAQDLSNPDEYCDINAVIGSCRYMAPEVMQAQTITAQADVYSFAILLWELITLQIPFLGVKKVKEMRWIIVHDEDRPPLVARKRVESKSLVFPLIRPQRLSRLLVDMWSPEPSMRPTFSRIQKTLMEVFNEFQARKELMLMTTGETKRGRIRPSQSIAILEDPGSPQMQSPNVRRRREAGERTRSPKLASPKSLGRHFSIRRIWRLFPKQLSESTSSTAASSAFPENDHSTEFHDSVAQLFDF